MERRVRRLSPTADVDEAGESAAAVDTDNARTSFSFSHVSKRLSATTQ